MKSELRSTRLLLRAPRPGDAAAVFAAWAQDAEVLRYMAWPAHRAQAETEALLAWEQARWFKRSACCWLLSSAAADQPAAMGMVQLLPQRLDGPAHHWRLGYLLARAHWGRGLMREAVQTVLNEAWSQKEVQRIDALCDVDNAASARLLKACGFEHEGLLRRFSILPNLSPLPRDVTVYAQVRDDA